MTSKITEICNEHESDVAELAFLGTNVTLVFLLLLTEVGLIIYIGYQLCYSNYKSKVKPVFQLLIWIYHI